MTRREKKELRFQNAVAAVGFLGAATLVAETLKRVAVNLIGRFL